MKHSSILFTAILTICTLCSSCDTNKETAQPDEIIINGHIEGLKDGTAILIGEEDIRGGSGMFTYNDTVRNERFQLSIKDSSQHTKLFLMIAVEGVTPSRHLSFWVKPGHTISITGKGGKVPLWTVESNVPEQKGHNMHRAATLDLIMKYEEINQEIDYINSSIFQPGIDKSDKEKLVMTKKSMEKKRADVSFKIKEKELELLEKSTPDSFWIYKLRKIAKSHNIYVSNGEKGLDEEKMKALYERMSDEQKNTLFGQDIKAMLFANSSVSIGDKMADTDLFDMDSNKRNLSDYSGKYRLLDFWSRGCGPCLAAMPEMKEVAEKYKDKLIVIGVNSDSKKIWSEFSAKNEMPGINLNDPNGETGLKLKYGVKGIPNYVLIGPDDTIVASWTGYGKGSLLAKLNDFFTSINK